MCQFAPAPLPGFKTPLTVIDFLVALLLLLLVLSGTLVFVTHPGSRGRRWFGTRGAVIVSLLPALCLAFVASMMWLFLIPSSEAIKHWDTVQRTMVASLCTADDLDAAYFAAFDRLNPYYNWLFLVPAACGAFGLLLLGWRWPIQFRIKSHE
jgi:hypothetical protein